MEADARTRQATVVWGERAPTVRFVLDQERLQLMGLSPSEVGEQIQFLLTGVLITQVREDIRTVDVTARTAGDHRLDPTRLMGMTLTTREGRSGPLSQIGKVEVRQEEPVLKRRDRVSVIT